MTRPSRAGKHKFKYDNVRNGESSQNRNEFTHPRRSSRQNNTNPGMEYCQTNPDHFHNNGNKSNNEMVQDVKQLQDSVQLLQQQFQQLSLNHQLLIGKHDAEISKLTLELQTLRDEMERGRRKIKKLRAKLASRETIPMSLHFQETVQAEPLMMSKSSGSGSKLKKTSGKVPDEPTQCPVCEKIFKLKRNYIKHQNQTKHGLLEDNSNSVLLSATRDNINQSDVSQVHLASGETVFTGVNHVQTPSKSDEKVNPQVEVIDPCHPLNGFTPIVIVNETTNSNTPDSSCRNIYPNKRKPESEIVSLLSEDEDVPRINIKKEKNSCPSCLSSFDDADLLTDHVRSSCQKNLCCEFCGKRFFRTSSLNLHIKSHEQTTDLYTCPTCEKSFKCFSNLQVHKELHLNERPYDCLDCGKRYRKETHLENHTITSHENTLKLFSCTLCPKSYVKEKLLEKHFRVHPVCIECGHSFKTDAHLGNHVKEFHAQLRVCKLCSKIIDSKEWKEHCRMCRMKKQTVICFYCSKIFVTSSCLKRHIKNKHEGLAYRKKLDTVNTHS